MVLDSEHILRHLYGISVAESQTFLRAKRAQRPRAMEKRMFSQAIYVPLIYIFHQLHVVIVSSFLLCANVIFHIYSCRCLQKGTLINMLVRLGHTGYKNKQCFPRCLCILVKIVLLVCMLMTHRLQPSWQAPVGFLQQRFDLTIQ